MGTGEPVKGTAGYRLQSAEASGRGKETNAEIPVVCKISKFFIHFKSQNNRLPYFHTVNISPTE